MSLSRLFLPNFPNLLGRLQRRRTFFYFLSGVFWIAGLFHPYGSLLFYFSLIYPTLQLQQQRPHPADFFYFLLPYFLILGLGVWNAVFPFGLGILLALLLCDLISKLLAIFLTPGTGGWKILLLPGALALLDAFFQHMPGLAAMEMIPVLAPVYHHAPLLAAAAWLGRHLTYWLLMSGATGILLLICYSFPTLKGNSFSDKRTIAAIALVCALTVALGQVDYLPSATQAPSLSVTAVQASLGTSSAGSELTGEEAFAYRYQRYLDVSGIPASQIVLFPEIMVGIYDTAGRVDQQYRDLFRQQAEKWDTLLVPLVLEGNSLTQDPADRRITALVVSEAGILGRSSKRNLVPFSETQAFGRGKDYEPIPSPVGRIGLSICFDANGPTIRRLAANSAQIILAPFNNTGFPAVFYTVHRFYTIIQAIEYQLPIVVANESGISQIIDRSGRIRAELAKGAAGTISNSLTLSTGPSPYLRWGRIWEIAALAALLLLRRRCRPIS